MEFVWSCMVITVKCILVSFFWMMAGLVFGFICISIPYYVSGWVKRNRVQEPRNKEPEDPEEWWKEQMKDRDKWGNA
jgi:hypothetical protein